MEEEFLDSLNQNNFELAAKLLSDRTAEDAARLLNGLDDKFVLPLCRNLDSDFLADILVLLENDLKERLISELHETKLHEVMDEVSVEDTVDLIEEMPEEVAFRITEEDEISELLREKNFAVLKPLLSSMNEIDLAKIFEEVEDDSLPVLFRILPKDLAADVFVELERDTKENLLRTLNDLEIKAVMDELFLDDTVDLIEEMPANVVKRLLAQSDTKTREYINEILKYPKDSAGSIMTIEYVALREYMSVDEAFDKIRKIAIDKETIYTCYVVDGKNKLVGMVSAKDLMLADKATTISDIMEESVIFVHTSDDKEFTARKLTEYGFLALPVVDDETRLVGIVTVDDAIDVLQEENTEDIAKMAAMTPPEEPYLKTGVFSIWKNRVPWLLILMISATFTGLILNSYEAKLSAISPVLFACVPMLMDTGGNSGSQASVTVIRSLALGELETKDILRVLWKELRVSLLLGATLAVACFLKLQLVDNLLFGYSDYNVQKCLIVAVSMFITIVLAKLVGSSLPLIAKKCKLDPAVVASPFITTIVDAISLIVFCSLSVSLLG